MPSADSSARRPEVLCDASDLTVSARVKWSGDKAPWQRIFDLDTDTTKYLFTTPCNGSVLRTAVTTGGGGAQAQVSGYARLCAAVRRRLTDGHRHPRHRRPPGHHVPRRRGSLLRRDDRQRQEPPGRFGHSGRLSLAGGINKVTVTLKKRQNTITFRSAELPNFDGTGYASDTFPGVLRRSRDAPLIDRITLAPHPREVR
ncbi:hypothetical protein [Streptomyces alanosinicus]|uniref:Uncharacterized protein n=1 Tax=Streptomyces alanosinicus TaxID=68171 RepID=A0A918YLZ1_9ACTN|nr:hypothetical protein [Streptomyces alanosinicus]GHE08867.1 hypothetical protein GCM10010339_59170 [Streptomyces alanosinicus]